jgi:hypothetical protein
MVIEWLAAMICERWDAAGGFAILADPGGFMGVEILP